MSICQTNHDTAEPQMINMTSLHVAHYIQPKIRWKTDFG